MRIYLWLSRELNQNLNHLLIMQGHHYQFHWLHLSPGCETFHYPSLELNSKTFLLFLSHTASWTWLPRVFNLTDRSRILDLTVPCLFLDWRPHVLEFHWPYVLDLTDRRPCTCHLLLLFAYLRTNSHAPK